jgi:hypothetical protein
MSTVELANQSSAMLGNIMPAIPTHFDRPGWLIASAAVVGAGCIMEGLASHFKSYPAYPVADPENATAALGPLIKEARRLTWKERTAMTAGTLMLGLTGVQLASPVTHSTEMHGSGTIILNVNHTGDPTDTANHSSRLAAGINGSLAAAGNENVPFTFMVSGNSAQVVDHTPATGKDLASTAQKIDKQLTAYERNGTQINQAVTQALGFAGEGGNNVIIVASNLSGDGANTSAQEAQALSAERITAGQTSRIWAILVGGYQTTLSVAGLDIPVNVDAADYESALGKNRVMQADSAAQVAQDIEQITNETLVSHQTNTDHRPEEAALAFGAAGAGMAAYQRLGGVFRAIRNRRKKGAKS